MERAPASRSTPSRLWISQELKIGTKRPLASDSAQRDGMTKVSDPLRPSHRDPQVRRIPKRQRQRDERSPGKQKAANLTCRLFIRRTSSKKSRDSMVVLARGTRARDRTRRDRRAERQAPGPSSHWTGPRRAPTSASGAGTDAPRPFAAESGQRDSRPSYSSLSATPDLARWGRPEPTSAFSPAAPHGGVDPGVREEVPCNLRKAGPLARLANREPGLRRVRAEAALEWPARLSPVGSGWGTRRVARPCGLRRGGFPRYGKLTAEVFQ